MRAHTVVGTVILFLTLSAFPFPSGTADSDVLPDHAFECGNDEPPSGMYLDYGLGRAMDDECRTKTLSVKHTVTNDCVYFTDGGTEFVALYGFYLGLSYVPCGAQWRDDRYKAGALVASVGSWNHSWETLYEQGSGEQPLDCADAPCCGPADLNPCVSNAVVTYCKDGLKEVGFYCPVHAVTIEGAVRAYSGAVDVRVDEVQSTDFCF